MDAINFLENKGIIIKGNKDFKVIFEDGREFSVVSLLEEYSLIKAHEIMQIKNK